MVAKLSSCKSGKNGKNAGFTPDAFQDAFIGELKMPSGVLITKGDSSLPKTAEILSDGSLAST